MVFILSLFMFANRLLYLFSIILTERIYIFYQYFECGTLSLTRPQLSTTSCTTTITSTALCKTLLSNYMLKHIFSPIYISVT